MTISSDAATLGAEAQWQRLSPAAIVHFAFVFVRHIAKNGLQTLAPVGAALLAAGEKRWLLLGIGLPAFVAVLLIGGILSYLHFRFRVTDNAFLIQKGVIQKKRLTLAFDRIQNLAIKEPLYFRPFGLVALALESAGSADEEVSLAGIPRTLATRIRATVLESKAETVAAVPTEAVEDSPAPAPSEQLLHQNVDELIRYGLSNNNVWVFAGLAVAAISQMEKQFEALVGHFIEDQIAGVEEAGVAALVLVGLGLAVALLLVLMTGSILGAIITFYDYRLSFSAGRFLRIKGLFERSETSLPLRKIQNLVVDQPWPALLMKRSHLTLKQIGFASQHGGQNQRQAKFIIPSVQAGFIPRLVAILTPRLDWSAVSFRGVHIYYVRKILTYKLLPPMLPPAVFLTIAFGPIGLLVLLAPLLLLPVVFQRWRRLGYWTDGRHGVVRTGFIGSKTRSFAFQKVQTVAYRQSPGERKRGLASLTVKLAGDTIRVPAMPLADAKYWHDSILFTISTK